jgi:hypothetical protein
MWGKAWSITPKGPLSLSVLFGEHPKNLAQDWDSNPKWTDWFLSTWVGYHLLKAKPQKILPPACSSVGQPNVEKRSLCQLGRRAWAAAISDSLDHFHLLFSTGLGPSSLKQGLWSCHTLLCQSDSNILGLGPSKWWTVKSSFLMLI